MEIPEHTGTEGGYQVLTKKPARKKEGQLEVVLRDGVTGKG